MMEAVTPPLGHRKEREGKWELTVLGHASRLPWGWSTSRLLILGGILVTSDGKTQCVASPPGNVTYDGGCHNSFGT